MTIENRQNYDSIMRTELDRLAEIDYARKEGEARGEARGEVRGRRSSARELIAAGVDKMRPKCKVRGTIPHSHPKAFPNHAVGT